MTARAKTDAERIQESLDDIARFTLALPEVVESTSYGRPALKCFEKLIFGTSPLNSHPFTAREPLLKGLP